MDKKLSVKIENGKINYSCRKHLCQSSCCGPFCGVSNDLVNLDERPFEEIVLTPEDYTRIYAAGYADLIEEGFSKVTGKKYFKMALEPNGTCRAFSRGLCSINDIKPTLCQAFPFYFDIFSGLCAVACEGFSDEHWTEVENCLSDIDAAKKMYAFWLEFYASVQNAEDDSE